MTARYQTGDLITWTLTGDNPTGPRRPGLIVAVEETFDGTDRVYEVETLNGGTVCLGEEQIHPATVPQIGQWWTDGTHRLQVEKVHRGGLLCDVIRVDLGRRIPIRDVAVVGYYQPEAVA